MLMLLSWRRSLVALSSLVALAGFAFSGCIDRPFSEVSQTVTAGASA